MSQMGIAADNQQKTLYYDKETLDRIFGVLLKFKGTSD
nr:MAG TPA: hypothetical protein [Caudoviricetes sp.]